MKEPDPLTLIDVVRRAPEPAPWAEGDNIPWHEPGFSARMLREHLSQEHDAASRRAEKIDGHVRWIHNRLLTGRPTRVLDLGCGPGLYSSRLAALGHECTGIDYSPASIEYATRTASEEHLQCTYRLEDIRAAEYGTGFGLAMLIYGELNIFRPDDAALILHKAYDALDPGGVLLLEPHTEAAVEAQGKQGRSWRSAQTGLFSDEPHICLTEGTWSDSSRTATVRHFVVDASTGDVIRHAQTFQAYTGAEYRTVLEEQGFRDVTFFASLGGEETDELAGELFAATARKL